MDPNAERAFFRRIVYISVVDVLCLVAGILFGPWEIDPHAENLLVIVANPGSVALGYLIGRKHSD